MPSKKKNSLPFDKRGGRRTIQGILLDSENYLTLSAQSKVLLLLMQKHWNNYKPVAFGIREAEKKIPCARKTALKAFNQLQERGFIEVVEQSMFSSTSESKARTWRLTWLPFKSEPPTNDWEMN